MMDFEHNLATFRLYVKSTFDIISSIFRNSGYKNLREIIVHDGTTM